MVWWRRSAPALFTPHNKEMASTQAKEMDDFWMFMVSVFVVFGIKMSSAWSDRDYPDEEATKRRFVFTMKAGGASIIHLEHIWTWNV